MRRPAKQSDSIPKSLGNLHFNLQLLETSGRKFDWSGLHRSFTVKTVTNANTFEVIDEDLFFEGSKLINIMSLYKSKKIAVPDLFSHESEYEAISGTIYYNHPFIIFTEENGTLKLTFANETVVDCSFI